MGVIDNWSAWGRGEHDPLYWYLVAAFRSANRDWRAFKARK